MSDRRTKRAHALTENLRNIGPTSDAKIKFIVDTTPFSDEGEPPSPGDWIITGRLLPNSSIYRNGSIQIHLVIGSTFPADPPKVYVKTQIYHPNVSKKGEVCIDLLNQTGLWKADSTLVAVIEAVTKIIDEPSLDHIQYPEAAAKYNTDKVEYERVATEIFRQNCAPRN